MLEGNIKHHIIFWVVVFMLSSCGGGKKLDFDSETWINDKMGCAGRRATMTDQVYKALEQLEGMKRNQVIEALGKPETTELYQKGQLIFRYYITPAAGCDQAGNSDIVRLLEVRLNALGIVSEANVAVYATGD